jgi:hypothetical protein
MCGFVIAEPDFPGWWVWLYYINPVSWLLYGGCPLCCHFCRLVAQTARLDQMHPLLWYVE